MHIHRERIRLKDSGFDRDEFMYLYGYIYIYIYIMYIYIARIRNERNIACTYFDLYEAHKYVHHVCEVDGFIVNLYKLCVLPSSRLC